jgi:hypothetical protein
VWIRGRVTDEASGKPVVADVEYHTFQANPHLGPNPSYEMKRSGTGPDGSYRLLGLPGPGFVAAKTLHDARYVRRVGFNAVFGERSGQDIVNSTYPLFDNAGVVNAVAGIDPAEGAEAVSCELKLSTGRRRTGKVVGPDGKPLAGCIANELAPGYYPGAPMSSAEFAVTALAPGEQRWLVFRHDARKLIGTVVVAAEAAGPLTVTLRPWSSLTGRVLDEDGEPRSNVTILLKHEGLPTHALGGMAREPARFEIGKDGRFRIDALAPGAKYDLDVLLADIGIIGYVAKGLVVESGAIKDLGDCKVVDTR